MTAPHTDNFIRHFLYVFGSQVIVLVTGFLKALVIPVILGVSGFGYWQIYVFYAVYVGLFTFGYNDGIYLKYGGYPLETLHRPDLRTSNVFFLLVLGLGAAAMAGFAAVNEDPQRQIIFYAVAANIVILGIISNISLTLQAANLLKGYAFLNSADKLFFTLALLGLVNETFRSFYYLIAIDLLSKAVVMAVLFHRYRQLFIGSLAKMSEGIEEFISNVGSGIQLLIANLSGMLVLGVGRIIVEYFGALDSYAHYAFAITLTNVVLMSVTAMSVVIYPTLKQKPQENYLRYFNTTNSAYSAFAVLMLTGYFPAHAFILLIATQYGPVIEFLNAMFVITVLQGKMQLINNTFYKALRLERSMLVANLSSFFIAAALSAAGYYFTRSVLAVAYATLMTMLIRVYASEIFLRRHMGDTSTSGLLSEVLVLAVFLLVTSAASPLVGFAAWAVFGVAVTIVKRKQLAVDARQIWSVKR